MRFFCFFLSATVILTLAAAVAQAGMVYDPWLERFQVGAYRQPDRIRLVDGWPEGLFDPLSIDPGWLDGAELFFASDEPPLRDDLLAWRFADLAQPEAGDTAIGYRRARRQWKALVDGQDPQAAQEMRVESMDGPWSATLRQMRAGMLWQLGLNEAAAEVMASMLLDADSLGMTPSEVFVWTLRALALQETVDHKSGSSMLSLWRCLADLGSYDTRSGWAVWVTLNRDRGLPPLPPELADRQAGVMLATAGQFFLNAAELRAASFPADVEAGLGALLLPASDLPAHFQRWPQPPADGRFQGYWLRGQRRLRSGSADIEKLAGLPALFDGHRLDLWRRASEGYLLRGQWEPGLSALNEGLALMDSEASTAMQDRMRIWVVQALALARGKKRPGDAGRIEELAARFLTADQASAYREDAGPLLSVGDLPGASDLRASNEQKIRRGEAPSVSSDRDGAAPLPPVEVWRHRLWASWANWGLALLRQASADTGSSKAARYAQELIEVRKTAETKARHDLATAAAARRLRGSQGAGPVFDWAVARDIERLSQGQALPHASPLPGLRMTASAPALERHLHDHALLGAAIALADDRGKIAMAVRLPAVTVEPMDRWVFWYPVPSDPAIRAALAQSPMPPELLLAIARNESLFEPAVRSRAGALGYMQIMPFHFREPAGPPGPGHWRHPAASLEAGSRVLGEAVRRHGGDPYRSVAAYNAGSVAVQRWDDQLGPGADPMLYRAWISYPETRGYTLNVLRDQEIYRALLRTVQ